MTECRIRRADEGDAALIAEEFWYPLAKQMEPYSELNELADDAVETARNGFETVLGDDQRYDFLLEEDGTAAAYIAAEIRDRPTRANGKHAAILDLYVKEGCRGQGYGSTLLREVESVATDENCDFMTVSSERGNEAAKQFYEAHQFEVKQIKHAKTLE